MTDNFLQKYGPWAVITGASSGIGEQFAHSLAQRGFKLLITARREDRLQKLAAQLQDTHSTQVEVLALDLAAEDFLADLQMACESKDIGLLVSNAGFGLKGPHHLSDPQAMSEMVNVNAKAPMLLSHYFMPKLIARGRGGIIMTGSIEGFLGFPLSASYAASKAFVHSLGEALWQELKPHNVDVLVLAPGSTDTEALSLQGISAEDMSGLMAPATVAELALQQLGRKRIYIAGWLNQLFVRLLTLLPRGLALSLTEAGMKSALKKR